MAFGEIQFDVRTPVADEGLKLNVAKALARGLPEIPDLMRRPGELITIVANGPTARQCTLSGPSLALNGALKLFGERGAVPTFWAACDPQEIVADFLDYIPEDTTYLVASKCHPKVFDRLKDRNVIVWHVDDFATWDQVSDRKPISTGVSITIVAFELMSRFGYDRYETWGWDGCYSEGRSHAVPQAHGGSDVTVEVGRQVFATTTTWALEAQDARDKLLQTHRDVKIRGGGFIGAYLQHQFAERQAFV
jgi:hypothetical protein